MPAHHAKEHPLVVANARHSPGYGCALRLDRAPFGALLGHDRKTLRLCEWVPAFAGMTEKTHVIPAKAGTHADRSPTEWRYHPIPWSSPWFDDAPQNVPCFGSMRIAFTGPIVR